MIRKLVQFSVTHPLLVNLFSVFIVFAGIISLMTLRREAFPNVNYDVVMVQTNYFGAPPEEVEKLITIELEDELKEVDDIDEMTSISAENISMIILQLDPDEKDKARIVNDIQRAVDRADDLPDDAEDPLVTEMKSKNFPVINVSLSGIKDEQKLQNYARQLEVLLLDLPDVAKVERIGWRDKEIWVEVDPERVGEDQLSLNEIMMALRNKNLNIPGGTLSTPEGDYLVRTMGEFETAEEVRNVIIRANDFGNWIRVKDVADVKETFEDDDVIEKTFGTQAINLTVVKKQKGDIIRLVKDIKSTADEFKKTASKELKISYFDDYSYYVKRRLNVLTNNGGMGLFFVMIALLVFLTRSVAFMTALGIPIALLAAFFMMSSFGMTVNLITMFALIMVLGLVVDDAIIVSENVYRLAEQGMPPREAAIEGTTKVAIPVITTVLTTIVAFIPLLFMSGIMGKFIWAIPVVVIIALIASLIECLLILPSHLAETIRGERAAEKKKRQTWFPVIQEKYLNVLRWVIGHKYKAIAIFFGVFVFSIALYVIGMKFILFPQGLIEEFFVRTKAPIGTSLEEMDERMKSVEKIVKSLPETELDNFVTQIGLIREDVQDSFTDRGTHLAQIHVFLKPEKSKGRRKADDIIQELRTKLEPIQSQFEELTFSKVRAGPPVGKPVSIRIRGDDFSRMKEVAGLFKAELMKIEGLSDIKDDFDKGKTELRVEVDEEKAAMAYLTIRDIATAVRNGIEGGEATKIRKTDEEIEVIVRFPKQAATNKDIFNFTHIPNKFGDLVPLNKVSSLKEYDGVHAIKHFDRKKMINVTSELDEKKTSPMKVERKMKSLIKETIAEKYPDITISFGGEQEETSESLQDFIKALVLALFMIFVILATNFNSIVRPGIVMMAIPFGIVGVILTFFFHGQPLSFMAMLGVIGLSGVVVNDSIVLVDFISKLREEGMERFESILESGKLRLRPVILTTITTIVGLLPVAYGIGGSDPFLKPMALAIGWGLLFATVLTLLLIPCLYSISDDATDWIPKIFKRVITRVGEEYGKRFNKT